MVCSRPTQNFVTLTLTSRFSEHTLILTLTFSLSHHYIIYMALITCMPYLVGLWALMVCSQPSQNFVTLTLTSHFSEHTLILTFFSFATSIPRPDDVWRIFDCSKHKHWRWPSPRLCEINKISTRWPDEVCRCQFQLTERRKATHRLPLMSGPTCSYGYRYMQHPGGLGKHVLFHVDSMAI